jgi:hypothetical protein
MREINAAVDAPVKLNEAGVEIEVRLLLSKVIEDGKITTGTQTVTIVRLLDLTRKNRIYTVSNFNDGDLPIEIVDYVKNAPDKEIVKIASRLLEIIDIKDANNAGIIKFDDELDIPDFIKLVLSKQE